MARIEYESLEFQNGYVYAHCALPLKDQGLVLIRGINLDDGGFLACGKTSLWEVFASVQVGHGGKGTGKHFSKDDVINHQAGKDFAAVLRYRVDGASYEIRQYRKHGRYGDSVRVVDASGRNIIPHASARYPHTWIRDEHLGLDETSFFNLIYLPQELNHVLLHGKDHERYGKLTTMFGLDVFDDLYGRFRDRLKALSGSLLDLEQMERELLGIDEQLEGVRIESLENKQRKLDRRLTTAKIEREEAVKKSQELPALLSRLEMRYELIRQVKQIWEEDEKLGDPKRLTEETVTKLERSADKAAKELENSTRILEATRHKDILQKQLKKLVGRAVEDIENDLSSVRTSLRALQVELPQAERRKELVEELAGLNTPSDHLEDLTAEAEKAANKEAILESDIERATAQISKAICPTCKRPFEGKSAEKLESDLATLRRQLKKARSASFRAKDALKSAQAYHRVSDALKNIETTRTTAEVHREIRSMTQQERELMGEREVSLQRNVLEEKLRSIEDLENGERLDPEDITKLQRRAGDLRRMAKAASRVLSRLDQISQLPSGSRKKVRHAIAIAEEEVQRASQAVEELTRETTLIGERIRSTQALASRREQIQKAMRKGASMARTKHCLEALKKAFGSQGLKQDRFRAILEEATRTTVPCYTNVLWPRRNVDLELTDVEGAIQFQVRRPVGVTQSNLLSGGERHKSGLAMLFGMRDLKERYTESRTNVLIVDEPFGSLDPQGTAGLLRIFQMLRKKFGSVFVISHRPEVLADPVWDQVWWCVRKDGKAELFRDGLPKKMQRYAEVS